MQEILNLLNKNSDAITSASAIIVAIIAVWGLNIWKKQVKGKTNYEIARRYLKASLKLRNEILYVRNPFIPAGEIENALKDSGLESSKFPEQEKINMAVYSRRWKRVQDAWTDLEVELLDAEASWGTEAVIIANNLTDSMKELFSALHKYLNREGKLEESIDKIIYNRGAPEKPDDFSRKVDRAIDKIKKFLEPHLL